MATDSESTHVSVLGAKVSACCFLTRMSGHSRLQTDSKSSTSTNALLARSKWDRIQVRTVCEHDRSIILDCNGHRLASHRFQQISRSSLRFAWLYVGLADCDVLHVVPAEASQLIAILCKGSSDDTERTESRFELFSDCCSIDSMTSFPTEPHSQGCQCREPRAQHLWPAS